MSCLYAFVARSIPRDQTLLTLSSRPCCCLVTCPASKTLAQPACQLLQGSARRGHQRKPDLLLRHQPLAECVTHELALTFSVLTDVMQSAKKSRAQAIPSMPTLTDYANGSGSKSKRLTSHKTMETRTIVTSAWARGTSTVSIRSMSLTGLESQHSSEASASRAPTTHRRLCKTFNDCSTSSASLGSAQPARQRLNLPT